MGKMVPATEFKAKCLALIDEMERSGEPLTVTRRGKASITLTANRHAPPSIDSVWGCLKGSVTWLSDDTGLVTDDPEWELDEPNLRRA
jgi:antitoxin (DNA-binding transcriptional repressor) of toxin-antitoxin stability system